MVSYFMPRFRLFFRTVNNKHAVIRGRNEIGRRNFSPAQQQNSSRTFSSNRQSDHHSRDMQISASAGYAKRSAGERDIEKAIPLISKKSSPRKRRRNSFTSWSGLLWRWVRWAPVGACVAGIIDWQTHKRKCNSPRTATKLQTMAYCSLPLRIISRCWGWIAACYVPVPLRPLLYGWYASMFNVDMSEALHPDYKHYSSIAEFFTRALKDGVRVIDVHAPVVSPADGKVLHFGNATSAIIEQVKGVNYKVQDFIGPFPAAASDDDESYISAIKKKLDGSTDLYQCVIYLAPGDYHRFHSPATWWPELRRHFPGKLLSVSPKIASWLPGLFCLNERVLYTGKWEHGFFSYTAVGATNVGSVEIYKDDNLRTNRWRGLRRRAFEELVFEDEVTFKKGELVGQFNMGSTIVLLFEAPRNFKFVVSAGQTIRVGEPLGRFD